MKKLKVLTVGLMLLFACNSWGYDFELDGIYYNVYKSQATVTHGESASGSYSGNVVIPDKIVYNGEEYDVTTIGENAFLSCIDLSSISLPNGLLEIDDSAFSWCTSLTHVEIPSTVTSIGVSAFSYCSSLFSVTMYQGVLSIGSHAFEQCTDLTDITLPSTITNMGIGVFDGCPNIMSVDLQP